MSLKIVHKNSSSSGTPPASGDIDVGELAINAADAELYTKDLNGNIYKFQNTTTGTAGGVKFTQAGSGAVQRTVDSKLKDVVSVLDFIPQAEHAAIKAGTSTYDAVAAINSAIAAGQKIIVPPGTYQLKSFSIPFASRPYPALNPPLIYILNRDNIEIKAYGATFVVDDAVAYSSAIHVDRCSDFTFKGGVIQGSRFGMTDGQENGGLTLTNIVRANFRDITFSTGWEGLGAPFVGNWIVDTTFDNITMQTCGIGFDIAHLKNVRLNAISAYGLGHSGTGPGEKFFSCIVDPPNAGTNYTGLDLAMSRNISITNCFATNLKTGAAIATGAGYTLSGNTWTKMLPPTGGYGIGVFIYYQTGTFTSEGYPANDISIVGDRFIENGDPATGNGAGVLVTGTAITNSDKISGITITGCVFDNNKATGIFVEGPATLEVITLWAGNVFRGASQTSNVNTTAYDNYTTSEPDRFTFKTKVVIGNNLGLWMQDSGGVQRPILSVSDINLAFLRPASADGYLSLQNFAGTELFTVSTSVPAGLPNNASLYFKDSGSVYQPILGVNNLNVSFLRPASASAYSEIQNYAGTTLLRAEDLGDSVSILVGSSLRRIGVGAADSGGTGFRMLIVPN
jgi:hypothetical protein